MSPATSIVAGLDFSPRAAALLSGGRIDRATLYRLVRKKGKVASVNTALLESLCDVLEAEPGELLGREPAKRRGKL